MHAVISSDRITDKLEYVLDEAINQMRTKRRQMKVHCKGEKVCSVFDVNRNKTHPVSQPPSHSSLVLSEIMRLIKLFYYTSDDIKEQASDV